MLNKSFNGLSDNRCSARVMPKMLFFVKKWMKDISAYVLEFMLTSAKMQDGNTLIVKKTSKTEARAF